MNADLAAQLVVIKAGCVSAALIGGDTWQKFMADAEQRTGLPWMEIKRLLDEQYAREQAG